MEITTLNSKARPTVTEIVLKNGMVLAVMGTRAEVVSKIQGKWEIYPDDKPDQGWWEFPTFVDFDVASVMDDASAPAAYTLRADEIVVIGSERTLLEADEAERIGLMSGEYH